MTDSVIDSKLSPPDQALRPSQWRYDMLRRGLYMLLFFAIYFFVELAIKGLVIIHFGYRLFSPSPQSRLLQFGDQLSFYVYQIWRYLTFTTDQRPWPFAPWPTTPSPVTPNEARQIAASTPSDAP